MPAMGKAYSDLLADRTSLLFQMQSYAASADPEIQARVRERYADLVRQVARGDGRRAGRAVVVLLQRDAAERDRGAQPRGARAERGVGGLLGRAAHDARGRDAASLG